jgi:sugar transferase (PEP-CTERM system associated)
MVLLALIEGALLVFAPFFAAAIRIDSTDLARATPTGGMMTTVALFAITAQLSLFAVGLYSTRQRSNAAGIFARVVAAITVAVLVSALLYFFAPDLAMGRGMLALTALIAVLTCVTVRLMFERIVDENMFKRRVLVYGAGRRAASLLELRRRSDSRGFRVLAFVAAEGDHVTTAAERLTERPADLFRWSQDNEVDEIVVAMDDRRRSFPMHEFLECRMAGIEVVELPTFLERETGKVRLDAVNPSWIIFGEGFRASPLQAVLERGFDIVASLTLLTFTLPVMLLTALAIRIEDGWQAPVLYRQTRVGRHSERFDVLKFRSMTVNAEQGPAVWAVRDDPRVTRVGRIIRKTRIDELPQLLNVLRGDMSFVGPRPERPEFVEQLELKIPYYRERHTVKPGITGWAQLCYPYGSSEQDAVEKLQYDLYYVKNRSLIFDFAILVQTVEVVLWGKGAR